MLPFLICRYEEQQLEVGSEKNNFHDTGHVSKWNSGKDGTRGTLVTPQNQHPKSKKVNNFMSYSLIQILNSNLIVNYIRSNNILVERIHRFNKLVT